MRYGHTVVLLYAVLIPSLKTHDEDEHHNGDVIDKHNYEKYYKKDTQLDHKNKSNRWKHYRDKIDEANAKYTDCVGAKCYLSQRKSDFRYWVERGGITKEDFSRGRDMNLGEHYQIIDHRLYRQQRCVFPARCNGNEHFILKIIHNLPDMEFIINSHDWPKVDKNRGTPAPVFSFSKTPREMDILYPAWSFWEGGPAVWPIYPAGIGRWDLMSIDMAKAAHKWPWSMKANKGYFRGSRTSAERDPLIVLSRKNERVVDAKYTKNQAYKSKADTLGEEPATEVPLHEHCKYKYLFNFRGIAASFRFKFLFMCRSLVFHVGEDWIEFFYPAMRPWVHYIPLTVELTEVEEIMEFVKENDGVVRKIAERGAKFVEDHLNLRDVEDYWFKILKKYGKLAKWKPKRDWNFMKIER